MDMRSSHRRFAGWTAAATMATPLVGCGGGDGGSAAAGLERIVAFGPIVTRVVGTAQPAVTSSGFGAVVMGVAGATISSMALDDNDRTLANSRIAFESTRDGTFAIYVMNANGANPIRLTDTSGFREP